MISPDSKFLSQACQTHEKYVLKVLKTKQKVLELCLDYYSIRNKKGKQEFKKELNSLPGSEKVIKKTVNFFLKPDIKSTQSSSFIQRQIRSLSKPDFFFACEHRIFPNSPEIINALKSEISYLNLNLFKEIITGLPSDIIVKSELYNSRLKKYKNKTVLREVKRLLSFLIDYEEFSKKKSIYTQEWGVYELTTKLAIRACLYCNRNYVITVMPKEKIIRPELDHFFPKSKHPLIALSFYNLIPSCHACNSNLKGKVDFSLEDYFHPYLSSFDKENIRFTYKPYNPKAFFGDTRNIDIKLNRLKIIRLHKQIEGNIKLFKLDEIYNEHQDIIAEFQLLQLKTNKKKIKDIYTNVLVDSLGVKCTHSEKEVYELSIRNYFSSDDYHKKPMSKFEKDIAEEIGLIKKT